MSDKLELPTDIAIVVLYCDLAANMLQAMANQLHGAGALNTSALLATLAIRTREHRAEALRKLEVRIVEPTPADVLALRGRE